MAPPDMPVDELAFAACAVAECRPVVVEEAAPRTWVLNEPSVTYLTAMEVFDEDDDECVVAATARLSVVVMEWGAIGELEVSSSTVLPSSVVSALGVAEVVCITRFTVVGVTCGAGVVTLTGLTLETVGLTGVATGVLVDTTVTWSAGPTPAAPGFDGEGVG